MADDRDGLIELVEGDVMDWEAEEDTNLERFDAFDVDDTFSSMDLTYRTANESNRSNNSVNVATSHYGQQTILPESLPAKSSLPVGSRTEQDSRLDSGVGGSSQEDEEEEGEEDEDEDTFEDAPEDAPFVDETVGFTDEEEDELFQDAPEVVAEVVEEQASAVCDQPIEEGPEAVEPEVIDQEEQKEAVDSPQGIEEAAPEVAPVVVIDEVERAFEPEETPVLGYGSDAEVPCPEEEEGQEEVNEEEWTEGRRRERHQNAAPVSPRAAVPTPPQSPSRRDNAQYESRWRPIPDPLPAPAMNAIDNVDVNDNVNDDVENAVVAPVVQRNEGEDGVYSRVFFTQVYEQEELHYIYCQSFVAIDEKLIRECLLRCIPIGSKQTNNRGDPINTSSKPSNADRNQRRDVENGASGSMGGNRPDEFCDGVRNLLNASKSDDRPHLERLGLTAFPSAMNRSNGEGTSNLPNMERRSSTGDQPSSSQVVFARSAAKAEKKEKESLRASMPPPPGLEPSTTIMGPPPGFENAIPTREGQTSVHDEAPVESIDVQRVERNEWRNDENKTPDEQRFAAARTDFSDSGSDLQEANHPSSYRTRPDSDHLDYRTQSNRRDSDEETQSTMRFTPSMTMRSDNPEECRAHRDFGDRKGNPNRKVSRADTDSWGHNVDYQNIRNSRRDDYRNHQERTEDYRRGSEQPRGYRESRDGGYGNRAATGMKITIAGNRSPPESESSTGSRNSRDEEYGSRGASEITVAGSRSVSDRTVGYGNRRNSNDTYSTANSDERSDLKKGLQRRDVNDNDATSNLRGSDTQSSSFAARESKESSRIAASSRPVHPYDARPMTSLEMTEMDRSLRARMKNEKGEPIFPALAKEYGTEIPPRPSFIGQPVEWEEGEKDTLYYYSPELHRCFPVSDEIALGWMRDGYLTGSSRFAVMRGGTITELRILMAEKAGAQAFGGYMDRISAREIDLQLKIMKTRERQAQLAQLIEAYEKRKKQQGNK